MIGQPITEDPQVGKCFYYPKDIGGPVRIIYRIEKFLPKAYGMQRVQIVCLTEVPDRIRRGYLLEVVLSPLWIECDPESDDPNGV